MVTTEQGLCHKIISDTISLKKEL